MLGVASRGWTALAFAIAFGLALSGNSASHVAEAEVLASGPAPNPTVFSGTGLPSLDPDDARFFAVAGSGLSTLAGVTIVMYLGVPAGETTFTVGLFDGEVGGAWDSPTSGPFSYRLWMDPLKSGTTAFPLDTISGDDANDDDWFDQSYPTHDDARAPSGNYFYRLEAGWTGATPAGLFNNFKVRTSGQISVRAGQDFGFAAGPQNIGGDPNVRSGDPNPGEQNDPNANSYDGEFRYFFYVPTTLTSITFWDGDNDRKGDTDDPNTPNADPDGLGPAQEEGEHNGSPSDDDEPGREVCCEIPPSIFFDLLDPAGNLYTNNDPSGAEEWERFIVGNSGSSPDILVGYELSAGLWRYRVQGMDAHNLNVLRSTYEIYSNDELPLPVNPPPTVAPDNELRSPDNTIVYYGHTVTNNGARDDFSLTSDSSMGWATTIYADLDADGVLDAGEPEISQTGPMDPDQTMHILVAVEVPDLDSGATDVTTVTASSRNEWALQDSATDTTRTNERPTAVLSVPSLVPEGTLVTLDATGSTDPDGDALEYRWDYEGDGTFDTDWGPDSFTTFTWGDDVTVNPVVEVRDAEFTATDTGTILIVNVAPAAEVTLDSPILEGSPYTVAVHVVDPGSDDLTIDIAFGDGSSQTMTICDNLCPDSDPSPDVSPFDGTEAFVSVYGDNALFALRISIVDDDEGLWEATFDADVENVIPAVSLTDAPSYSIEEAQGISLEASATDPGSDDLTFEWDFGDGATEGRTYFNDGTGPDPASSPGGTFPFTALDSASHVYGDDGTFLVTLRVSDDDGGSVTIERSMEVRNVAPTIDAFDAYSMATFRLRVAGEKWHDVRVSVLGGGDSELAAAGVTRYPGSPDEQSATTPLTRVDLLESFRVIVYYTPDDDPVNGRPWGANPVWVIVTRPDGQELRLFHNFNVRHPATWEWEPGAIRTFIASGGMTVEATASDPGSDDLTFRFEFGDGGAAEETIFNNGVSPDPDPSTDVNPITATVRVANTYAPGTYTLRIIVWDDDGGIVEVSVTLDI